jgi:hypothetical protein
MKNDPIVTEVHAIRDELAGQCDYDIRKLFQQLRKRQADSARKYVRYPARRIAPTEDLPPSTADAPAGCC